MPKTKDPGAESRPEEFVRDMLQRMYRPEFRVHNPGKVNRRGPRGKQEAPEPVAPAIHQAETAQPTPQPAAERESLRSLQILAIELAHCLWFLKTKHFKREWVNEDTADEDGRVRTALGRLNRGVKALAEAHITVVDPTGSPYPVGGEGYMRPLQFEPTAGTIKEVVSQTVRPAIFFGRTLISAGRSLRCNSCRRIVSLRGFKRSSRGRGRSLHSASC